MKSQVRARSRSGEVGPLAIDLYCGLGGWAEGLLSEGYDVVGFDIERHDYGTGGYPGQLVIQDVLTLHGSQFKDATVIVASPPCQKYSYMAMPWSRAKAQIKQYEESAERRAELNALFNACFRIQREACEAAGHHIPLIVENVRGAQRWVGRSAWNFGSYHLWGDVPALMPLPAGRKTPVGSWDKTRKNYNADHSWETGHKTSGMNWSDQTKHGQDFTRVAGNYAAAGLKWGDCNGQRFDERPKGSVAAHREGTKVAGLKPSHFPPGGLAQGHIDGHKVPGFRFDGSGKSFQSASVAGLKGIPHRTAAIGRIRQSTKQGGDWFGKNCESSMSRLYGSKSSKRKAASAMIAKIPFPLASYLASVFKRDSVQSMKAEGK